MVDDKKLNGWSEWAHRVLGDIERLEGSLERVEGKVDIKHGETLKAIQALAIEIAILKTKAAMIAGIWGSILGIIASIITSLLLKGGK